MENAKKLSELRAAAMSGMKKLIDTATKEERALSDEENTRLEAFEKDKSDIDRTIAAEKRAMELFKASRNCRLRIRRNS